MNGELQLQLWSSLPVPAILLDAEERIADIRPWLTTKMQGFTTMSKDRKKRSRDWNYQVTIKNII